jgi:hypothetical protein
VRSVTVGIFLMVQIMIFFFFFTVILVNVSVCRFASRRNGSSGTGEAAPKF